MIDDEGPRAHPLSETFGAKDDLLDIAGIGDADEDDLARRAQSSRRLGDDRIEALGSARRSVPDGQVVSGREEIGGHAPAHGAQPEETEFRHDRDTRGLLNPFTCLTIESILRSVPRSRR